MIPFDISAYLHRIGQGRTPATLEGEQQAPNGIYMITDDKATGEKVLNRRIESGWFPVFGFDDAHVIDMDSLLPTISVQPGRRRRSRTISC